MNIESIAEIMALLEEESHDNTSDNHESNHDFSARNILETIRK